MPAGRSLLEPAAGQHPQPPGLVQRHRLRRLPEAGPLRVFTSTNTTVRPVAGDDVDLALAAAPVAVEHLQARRLQVLHRELLAVPAQRLSIVGGVGRCSGDGRADPRAVVRSMTSIVSTVTTASSGTEAARPPRRERGEGGPRRGCGQPAVERACVVGSELGGGAVGRVGEGV